MTLAHPAQLARGGTIGIDQLDRSMFDPAKQKFGKLPAGAEGVYLITSDHPLSPHLIRVDEVGDAQRAAYRAELDALGYRIASEQPIAVRRAEPVTFPRSAIPDHPEAVNQLLAIDRSILREIPTLAEKPGRAETNLYALLPQLKKLDAGLALPFYDRLIDLYLDAGNEHYANRQAKLALGLLPKGDAQVWLVGRVRALLDRRFYSTLLVDAALAATAKISAKAALDLHLEIVERVLAGGIKPYKGLLAGLDKRAATAKAVPRVHQLLLAHAANPMLLANPEHDELSAVFEAALEVIDALPKPDRVARLTAIADHALGEGGEIVHRATAWRTLTERLDELPELCDPVISLAFRICKNIQIGYENDDAGIGKDFRARVGQFLQKLPAATLARRFDDWAAVLEGYEDWARAWFYDTYLTLEELVPSHPGVFAHDGIARAVTKGLLLGAVYASNHDEFVDKLQDFLDQTAARYVRVDDLVRLALDLLDRDRPDELTPLFEKLALHARDTLQQVVVELARRATARGLTGEPALRAIANHARWLTAPTRAAITQLVAATDPWDRFVEAAIDGGTTIGAPEVWAELSAAQLSDYRAMLHDHRIVDGRRYVAVGKPDYKGALSILVDGARTFQLANGYGDDETYQTAKFRDVDGQLRLQILFGDDDDEPWKLRTIDLDGGRPGDVALGAFKRCAFARHAPWIVAMSNELVAIFDLDGAKLAEYELAIKHPGGASDLFKAFHPLRDHVVVRGERQALILGADPAQPMIVDRKIAGTIYRGGRLLLECRAGKTSELVDTAGRPVEALAIHVTGALCGQCEEIHDSEYQPTNLRGGDGEILAQESKAFHQIQTVDNRVRGKVAIGFTSQYYLDLKLADLDGDGIDEAWCIDYTAGRLLRVADPAARHRAAIVGLRDALRELPRPALRLAPATAAAAVARHVAATIDEAPAVARDALRAPEFEAARTAVAAHHALLDEVYRALASTSESWPVPVVSRRVRLPSSELARLKTTYFDRPLDDYPIARALETGSLEPYEKHWVRRENKVGPDLAYLRQLIHAHLELAREPGLHPDIRSRALDLIELLVARTEAPDVQLFLSADEVGDGWLRMDEDDQTAFVATRTITAPLAEALAQAEQKWGVGGFAYTVGEQRGWSIGDVSICGRKQLGAATLTLWFHADAGESMIHQEEPELTGPVADVMAALPVLIELTKWKRAHEGVPAKVWPDGAHSWKPLDEWMIPEERAAILREVGALRAAGPKESTIGRAAHGELLGKLAAQYAISEDAAAVLAALILARKFDRAELAAWAKVKPDALLKQFKALIDVGLVKAQDREYLLDVPLVGKSYGKPDEPAFQRVFWTAARESREHPSKCVRRFAEADVLAGFSEHVPGGRRAESTRSTKPAGKVAPAGKAKPRK